MTEYKQEKFFDAPVAFSFDGWKADLQELFNKDETTQWDIGDLLLAAEDLGGIGEQEDWTSREAKKFRREAVRITKKAWKTLKNYKSISRKFPKHPQAGAPSLRSDTLSYGVHVLVAPFAREHQVRLLERAEKEVKGGRNWTVNDMRELIQRERSWGGLPKLEPKGKGSDNVVVKFKISSKDHAAFCKIAASRKLRSASDAIWWMVRGYWAEHKPEIEAYIQAYDKKLAEDVEQAKAKSAAEAEENRLALERMEEELDNDVENKIPSY